MRSDFQYLSLPTAMTAILHGFCMKCKDYVAINEHQYFVMKNGRTRVAGNCSVEGCSGRISKIVS